MKIICSRNNLLTGIGIVLKAVSSKTTLSILECILIDTSSGKIKLTGNDMELGIETIVDGEVIDKGMIAINAKIFNEIIRKLDDNEVTITTDENFNVTIICERVKYNIPGLDGSNFSFLPEIEKENTISLSQFSLKEIVRQTIFAINENDKNKKMGGECFSIIGNRLRVSALDGHRIAIKEIELKSSYENKELIIPGKTLNEISKILSDNNDEEININFTRNHIIFEFDNTIVVSRLIEGDYFPVDKMVSTDYTTKVVINKRELLSSIERASLLVELEKKPIVMYIESNVLRLDINSAMGKMAENIEITKEGNDLVIGFNPRYFTDVLKVINEEEIEMYLSGGKQPCVIRNEEEGYNYVILPVSYM